MHSETSSQRVQNPEKTHDKSNYPKTTFIKIADPILDGIRYFYQVSHAFLSGHFFILLLDYFRIFFDSFNKLLSNPGFSSKGNKRKCAISEVI
jgi:hypothetical protein